ncbi:tandem-95 repeat protein [Christiangramia echinicola]|uniref:Gliding motility-associated C-terminal domain-containing protein n=1 Tax=Christiangramia echinicola TaxID=279359 RepID=A0A1H1R5C3_9FLAO|nr:Ig-like domain-containing protein [Christiangramia echinicola]SDS30716.1 gliding motility-associated C-terminal domain-containing protein [Christiangramia echinicola]
MVEIITLSKKKHTTIVEVSEKTFFEKLSRILILLGFLLSVSYSQAQLIPVLDPNGGLRIDGDLTADLPVGAFAGDWVPYYWSSTNSYETSENNYVFFPNGNAVDPNTSRRYVDPYNSSTDNIYTGSKASDSPADWKRTTLKPQGKSDINNAFYHIATDATGSDWLFVGSDRMDTQGTGYIDFEFFQKPVYEDPNDNSKFVTEGLDGGRTVNDVLITLSYDNGGSTATVDIYFWKPDGAGGFHYELQSVDSIDAYGATNTSGARIPFGAFGSLTYSSYQFVEAAINMTAIMSKVVVSGPCIGVTVESLLVKTKSSTSLTADLKDYIGPKPVELVFGGANVEYNPLTVCNYYDKVLPTFSGVEGGEFTANSSDLDINKDSGEINVRNSEPGDYTITYTFTSYGCEKEVTAPFTVVPIPADKPTIANISQPFCATTTGELSVENPDPELSYFIRDENGINPEIESANGEFFNIQPDKYYLYSKTSFGCVSDSESFEIKEFIDSDDPSFDFISGNLKFDNDPGNCSAVVDIPDVLFSDNCPGTNLAWTLTDDATKNIIDQNSGQIGTYTFPVGKSILEYTLTDASGNTKLDKFNIEIEDVEVPVITANRIEADTDVGLCSAAIPMPSATAVDNCEIDQLTGTRDDGLELTDPYPTGITTITWEAQDIHGNKAIEVDQIIEVNDNEAPVTPALADVTVDCNGSLTAPTTTDACAGTITGTTTDSLSFVEGGSTVITWTFDDGNGNTTTADQTYNYDDTTAPVTPTLADVTVDCNGSLTAPTTTDACAGTITGTTTDSLSFVEGGSTVITWTFDDGNGNTTTADQTYNYDDTTAPVTPTLADVTVDCNGSLTAPTTTDACAGTITGTTTDSLSFVEGGSTVITWTFDDGNGNTTTADQTYNYDDTTAPVTPTLTDVTIDCNGSLTAPTTTDACAGTITGTTTDSLSFVEGGSTVITWTFDDGNGNTTTADQTYNYDDTTAPVTPTLTDVTIDCNGSLTAPTTTDACAGTITGTTTDSLSFVEGGSTVITWTFDDGNGNTTTADQTYNYDDTTAPVTPTLADVTVDCNGSLTAPTTTDACAGTITGTTTDSLSFVEGGSTVITWTFDDGNGNTTTADQTYNYDDTTAPVTPTLTDVTIDCNGSLTAPTTTDACAGTITGTTTDSLSFVEGGSTVITWTFDDGNGNTTTADQTYNYDDTTAPVTPTLADVTVDCNGSLTAPTTTDACAGTITGTTTDSLSFVEGGSTVITWTFDDGNGNTTTADQTYNYDDTTAPVTPTLTDVTIDCNGSLTAPTTTDACAGTITGTTTDSLSFVEGGSTVITWTFDDGNGNTTTADQTYNYDDTTAPVTPTLTDVTIDCNGSLTAPTTTDACAGTITGTTTDSLSFVEGGSTVITWTFDDGNGNTTTADQTYNYDDTTAPVTPTLADVTVDCNGSLTAPTTTDACAGTITGTTTDSLSFVEGGSTVITWTFDDGNGNTTTADQTYNYDDTTAPVTPTLADVTVDCNGSLTAPTTTDACAGTITGTTTDSLSFVEGGSTVITWTFDDGNGNTTTADQTYNYDDTTAPVTPTLADVTVDCNGSLTAPTTTDACAGTITGTTTDSLSFVEGGSTVITWTFDDGNGNTTTADQTYNYDDTTAPVTPTLADVTVDCNGSLTAPTTTDACAGTITGTTTDSLSFVEGGSTVITWTFDDGNGNTTTADQTYNYDDTTAPVTPTLTDVTIDCNGSLTAPTTTDACAGTITGTTTDSLSFVEGGSTVITWTFDDGNGNTTTADQTYNYDDTTAPVTPTLTDVTIDCNGSLTAPTTTDACAGTITGTTTDSLSFVEGGSTVITWTFDDGNGNTTTADQTYNYDDTTAPVTPTLADVTVDCNGSLTAPTTTDACAGTITGTTTDSLSFVEGGSTVITWTFDDGNGNTTTADQTYNYDDTTAPVTPTLADVTVDCNGSLTAPTTTDACAGTITGTTTDSLSFVEGGSTVITWTFDDGNGNTTTADQTYNYDDTTAPVTPTLADVTVDCNGSLTAPTTTDACAGTITGTTTDSLSFVEGGSTVITWTFDDGNGNTTTADQTYNYDDTTAPVTPTLADVTVDCNGSLTAPTTTDACAGTITGTTTDSLSFVEGGSTVITWTFDDGNGNTTTADQTYNYDDTTAPVTPTLADVTVDCNGSLTAPTTTDACAGTITGTTTDSLSFVEGGSTVITWTFDDGNGNTTTADQTYNYDDTTAPVTPTLTDVTIDCNGSLTAPTTTDACAGTITGTTTDSLSFVEGGSTVITWTFDDGNGNTTTADQTYNYDDTTAPVTPALSNVTVDCNGSLTAPTTTDACAGTITGTTTDSLSFVEGGSTVITWTFDDGNGNTTTADQTYNYDDTTAPVTPTLADVTVDCNGSLTAPTTTDACAGTITGTTTDSLSFVEGGSTVITWTFDDGNGNTTTADQTYNYDDTTAPVTPALSDVTVDCNGSLTAPTTTDACAGTITGTTTDSLSFVEGGSTVITWTFDDGNGNTTTANQTYNYNDTTAPVTPTLTDVIGQCTATAAAPTTSDNCMGTITGTTTDPLTYSIQGTHVITWTFDDGNGQSITVDQNVIINDTTAPIITSCPSEINTTNDAGENFAVVTFDDATASDNCSVNIVRTSSMGSGSEFPVGTNQVTYLATDVGGNTAECTFNVIVKAIPVANDDSAETDEEIGVIITVLENDIDLDSSLLSVKEITNPTNGTILVNPDQTITYTPNTNFNGIDTFTYKITDGEFDSEFAVVTIDVGNTNDAPVANDDEIEVSEGGTTSSLVSKETSVLTNDSDIENNSLTASLVNDVSFGDLTLNEDGSFTYTHDGSENFSDEFTYIANDGFANSNIATVTITITEVNDAPVANNDTLSLEEGATETVDLADNDTDIDGTLDLASIVIVSAPANGSLVDNGDGTFDYTHNGSETTSDSFTYTIEDNDRAVSNIATVTITITEVNDAPVANNDTLSLEEGATETVDLADNDTDIDGTLDLASIVIVSAPANGSLVDNGDGTFDYTHNGSETTSDSFTYTIEDNDRAVSNIATVTITITEVNDAPVANNDTLSLEEGATETVDLADNDTDIDGTLDLASIVIVSAPANGSLVDNGDGTFDYTHNGSETTSDSFTYTIEDNDGAVSNIATVTITITEVNDAPVANNDTLSLEEGATETVDLADNDTDIDGTLDLASIVIVSAPANGSLVDNGDGTFDYTHNGSETTSDSFTYTIEDNDGAVSNIATVTITITEVNDAPVANNDTLSLEEGATETVDLADNDTDIDGTLDLASIVIVSAPANGSLVDNGDGTFDYTHNGTETTSDSFTYTIEDNDGAVSNIATVTITITEVNDAPVANNDTLSLEEGATETVDLADNDTDIDGTLDLASIVIVSAPANGSLVDNGDGTFDYTHNGSETTSDSFTYTIEDNDGAVSNIATVTITITEVNDAPVANNDTLSLEEGATETVDLADNDTDIDGTLDLASIVIVSAPANGSLVDNGDGTFDYTHNGSETTSDSFTYTIEDNDGAVSNIATVTITITEVNDAPVANNDTLSLEEGATETVDLADNDTDIDGTLDLASIVIVSAPANGSLVDNGDGTFDYTHNGSETTSDSFTYTIEDNDGAVSNIATVTITITEVNDAPVANNDTLSLEEGATETVDLADNDTDIDGTLDLASIVIVSAPANGSLVDNGDGTFDYTHNGSETTSDSFTYTIEDNDGAVSNIATVTVNVGAVNDAPIANDDTANTSEDTEVTVAVLDNDSDLDGDILTVTITEDQQPVNGTVTVNADGTVTYTPDDNFNGADSFEYTISDGNGGTDTATVTVTVGAVNDAPIANDDTANTSEDTEVTVAVLDNDSDLDGDTLTVTITEDQQPANGTVTVNADGTVIYTPDDNFNGTDSFEYTISDGNGGTDTATVTVTVGAVNDAPIANDDTANTSEDTEVTVAVLDNDSDLDGDTLTVTITEDQQPANGTVTVNADGTVIYTPDDNFNGTDSFEYTISDGNGGTDTATVTVTVGAVNDAPIANDDTANTSEDTEVTVAVLDNDSDLDGDTLTVTITEDQQPDNGTVTVNADGTVIYTPDENFNGTDSFEYTISDGNGGTDTATVTVTVGAVNDAPIANDDTANTSEDTEITIAVLDNDSDLDGDTLTVTITEDQQPDNGTVIVNADGTVIYTPDENFNGTDSFEYTISDGNGGTDTATVTVTVGAVNDAPIANDDTAETNQDIATNVEVLLNDSDIDGDILSVDSITQPDNGSVTTDGVEVTYVPNESFTGTDTFTYTITDGNGGVDTATVTVKVLDTEGPEISCPSPVILNNDFEKCGAAYVFNMPSITDNSGTAHIIQTGGPVPGEIFPVGETTLSFIAKDESGNSTECNYTVTVLDNEAPVISKCAPKLIITTDQGLCSAFDVELGNPDVDDNCDSELSITNNAPEVFELGETIVTWTVTDNAGNSTQCTQSVNVIDDQAPVIINCATEVFTSADAGLCSASNVELGNLTAEDNCSGELEIINDAPEIFSVGTTVVTWTVKDNAGNSTQCIQNVTVIDEEKPVIEEMEDINLDSDPGVCGAVVTYSQISSSDNCGIETVMLTEGIASGEVFPIGTTTVTWTVTDIHGNVTIETFIVTIKDTEAPELTCPENIIVDTVTGENYAIVDFPYATATDNCGATVEQTAGPVSGSQFPIGTTSVTFTATDAEGNTTECSLSITVEDNEDPTIECLQPIVQAVDSGICGAIVNFETPSTFDNSGEVTIEQIEGPESGEVFPVGITTVSFKATDSSGNTAECSFEITIVDDEAPAIAEMDNIVVNNDSGICGAIVNFEIPGATDNCGIESIQQTEGLASGEEFPVGSTSITFTATDTAGLTSTTSFTVTVQDNEAPVIECPDDIVMNVEYGTSSVIVEYEALIITENCGETTTEVISGIASGEEFPIGTTTISYVVTDSAGNSSECNFDVEIVEDAPPAPPTVPAVNVIAATCIDPFGTITIETIEGLTYSIDGENYQESGVFADLDPDTYEITARDEFGQVSEVTTITIEAPMAEQIEVVDSPELYNDGTLTSFDLFELLVGEVDESGTWIDDDNTGALDNGFIDPSIMEDGTYIFTYELGGNCPSSTEVIVTILEGIVLDCSLTDLKDSISKAVTPNGDNRNDFFEVDLDTECGLTYDLKIFNRWGNEVFTAQNYQNNWDGYSESSFTNSNQLPSGTYFYILEIRNSEFAPIQGYIYLGTK